MRYLQQPFLVRLLVSTEVDEEEDGDDAQPAQISSQQLQDVLNNSTACAALGDGLNAEVAAFVLDGWDRLPAHANDSEAEECQRFVDGVVEDIKGGHYSTRQAYFTMNAVDLMQRFSVPKLSRILVELNHRPEFAALP